jgi:hypothetical protein
MTTTMQLIAKQTVNAGGASSVTFSNIPQTYTDLKVVCTMRTDRSATEDPVTITFNTGGTYSDRRLWANGSSVASYNATTLNAEYANSTSSTASTFSNFEMYIPNYTSSNAKSISYDSVTENNATTGYNILDAALWTKTPQEAITSITLDPIYGNFVQYCTFYLYGISNSTTTQATTVPYASGGDVITTDGTYWYHAFKYSGSFTPLKNLTADVLVVAGGGAGGNYTGGGGGAGGLLTFSAQALTSATNYNCTIGAGGTAQSNYSTGRGGSGGNSVFGALTASVGGGGGGGNASGYTGGANGGSGGGAAGTGGTSAGPGTGTSGQGNSGGTGGGGYGSGGGGGAGAAGGNGPFNYTGGGAGGIGVYSTITDAMGAATVTGVLSSTHYYYAGGGGAGAYDSGGYGAGGTGGGGNGGNPGNNNGNAGTANTGGGGGGGTGGSSSGIGANGGSGIIIVRYAV